MDPTPFLQLGLKAVPIAVDKYPNYKQKLKSRRGKSRGGRKDDGYDSYPGPSKDRDSKGRRYSTQDAYASGRDRDRNRGRDRRRSVGGGDGSPEGGKYKDIPRDQNPYYGAAVGRRPSQRYDAPRERDRDYYNSEAESPPPGYRRVRKSKTMPLGIVAAGGAAEALYSDTNATLGDKTLRNMNSTALTRYEAPSTRNTQMTRYTPSTRRSKSEARDSDSDSSSSSTTISLSSTEDEKRARKLKYSVPLTAGIAAVATVHALNGVHKSVKAHDQRILQVDHGEMTKDEAKSLQRKGLIHDAAKIGLGVMAIQAATAKWKEVAGDRHEYKQHKKDQRERDRKREEKAEKERRRRREARHANDRDRDDKDRNGRGDRIARRSEPDFRRHQTR